MNTALRRLFPDSVALASCRLQDFDEPSILPAELAQLCQSFSTARRTQFLCGRWCAARALEQLDAAAQVIGRGADREPVWPPGITGSISHSGDWAIAATRSILLFSAKEAFYKWQFPSTRARLGFLDVDIRPASDGMSLTLELLSEEVAQELCDRIFTIRYTIWNDYLVTGIHQ